VYHLNAVDTVTQWQVVGCTETISERHLIPVLEAMLHQFPFRIVGFHCDNGSEFVNHTVVKLLNKLLVEEFTKSRPYRTTDNALVEGKNGAVVRKQIARLAADAEVARVLGLRFVAKSMKGGAAPTSEASEYKLFATELSKRLANASMDLGGPGSQLRVKTEEAPMKGRAESTYRYTVIDTVGGGGSEIQKNIISRRKLGLPKNF